MGQNPNKPKSANNVDVNKIAAPAITMTGCVPSEVTWRFTPAEVKKYVVMLFEPLFPNMSTEDVGIFLTDGGDRAGVMVKISKDSSHIVDKSSKDLAVKAPIYNQSPQLKEMMEKYCPKNCKRLIPDQDNRYFDIALDLERVFTVIIDRDGNYAKDVTGNEQAYKCNLSLTVLTDRHDQKVMKMLEVKKTAKSVFRREPRPTKSFNF